MRKTKHLLWIAGALLAVCLTACGSGQSAQTEEVLTAACQGEGAAVQVSADVSGGWRADFDPVSVRLYAPEEDGGRDPVAIGLCEGEAEYARRLQAARALPSYTETEEGVAFTDGAGLQEYILDLGENVHYTILAQPDCDAQAVFSRFDVTLTARTPAQDDLFLTLVNRTHKLPDDWESRIRLVDTQNYSQQSIQVEENAYQAFRALQEDVRKDGVQIELESSYRSVERQKDLWAEYEQAYGLDYCRHYVAVPGFSEHHTGLAIDVNLIQPEKDQTDEERAAERAALWAKVHAKLAAHGFILRYPEGRDDVTGYSYEPWHIRYVGDPAVAGEIMETGVTLEEYLNAVEPADAVVDYGTSAVYDEDEMREAVAAIRAQFDTWTGCELRSVRYAGDQCYNREGVAWLSSVGGGKAYAQCIEFVSDFRSGETGSGYCEPNTDYTDYQWWLARTLGGEWELLSWGA